MGSCAGPRRSRVGGFLEKQGPVPRDGYWPPSGQERRPCGKCKGSGVPSVTLRLLGSGGASEELRGDKLREARAALGGAWLVRSEEGARRAGERQGSQEDAQNGAGKSGGREGGKRSAAEDSRLRMRAASLGTVPCTHLHLFGPCSDACEDRGPCLTGSFFCFCIV